MMSLKGIDSIPSNWVYKLYTLGCANEGDQMRKRAFKFKCFGIDIN